MLKDVDVYLDAYVDVDADAGVDEELQGVTRKKRTATDLLVLTRLFGT